MPNKALVVACLPLLCLSAAPTGADQKAEALLKRVAAVTRAVKTLSADVSITTTQEQGGKKSVHRTQGTVRLMRPNFVRIELTGHPFPRTQVSDGKTVWSLYRVKGQIQYMKQNADPKGQNSTLGLLDGFYFDLGHFDRITYAMKTRVLGPVMVNGKKYRIIEAYSPSQSGKLYIGADNLIHRISHEAKQGEKISRYEESFKNIKTGMPMRAAQFAYRPPRTAKLFVPPKMPDYTASLVAIGKAAPAFTLPTATGNNITLKDAVQGKKAVLVNFWFYG